MENKYFTPDIEDFHVGYEYETIYLKNAWTKESLNIMDAGWFFESYKNDAVSTEFRVPYLTKEQIEAEGWKHVEGKLLSGANQLYEKKEKYSSVIIYSTDNKKIKVENLEGNILLDTVECKNINTFKKIIKLLEI